MFFLLFYLIYSSSSDSCSKEFFVGFIFSDKSNKTLKDIVLLKNQDCKEMCCFQSNLEISENLHYSLNDNIFFDKVQKHLEFSRYSFCDCNYDSDELKIIRIMKNVKVCTITCSSKFSKIKMDEIEDINYHKVQESTISPLTYQDKPDFNEFVGIKLNNQCLLVVIESKNYQALITHPSDSNNEAYKRIFLDFLNEFSLRTQKYCLGFRKNNMKNHEMLTLQILISRMICYEIDKRKSYKEKFMDFTTIYFSNLFNIHGMNLNKFKYKFSKISEISNSELFLKNYIFEDFEIISNGIMDLKNEENLEFNKDKTPVLSENILKTKTFANEIHENNKTAPKDQVFTDKTVDLNKLTKKTLAYRPDIDCKNKLQDSFEISLNELKKSIIDSQNENTTICDFFSENEIDESLENVLTAQTIQVNEILNSLFRSLEDTKIKISRDMNKNSFEFCISKTDLSKKNLPYENKNIKCNVYQFLIVESFFLDKFVMEGDNADTISIFSNNSERRLSDSIRFDRDYTDFSNMNKDKSNPGFFVFSNIYQTQIFQFYSLDSFMSILEKKDLIENNNQIKPSHSESYSYINRTINTVCCENVKFSCFKTDNLVINKLKMQIPENKLQKEKLKNQQRNQVVEALVANRFHVRPISASDFFSFDYNTLIAYEKEYINSHNLKTKTRSAFSPGSKLYKIFRKSSFSSPKDGSLKKNEEGIKISRSNSLNYKLFRSRNIEFKMEKENLNISDSNSDKFRMVDELY